MKVIWVLQKNNPYHTHINNVLIKIKCPISIGIQSHTMRYPPCPIRGKKVASPRVELGYFEWFSSVEMLIKYSTTKLWDFKMVDPERFELSTDGLLDHRSTDWAKGPFSFGWKMWSCNLWLCQKPWPLKIIALCFNIIDLIYPSQYYHSLIILTNN